jgi:Na+/melibiose symporter-like transporter
MDVYKEKMVTYLTIEAIISASAALLIILFFRSKPKIPPSNSQNDYQSPPLMICLKMMLKNKSFLLLLLNFTCVLTYLNVYGTILNECFGRYNFADQQTSTIGVIANAISIIGSLGASMIIDKLKNYKTVQIFMNFAGLISHITMSIILETVPANNSFVIIIILWSICNTSIITTYTSCMDLVIEITYPVGESISGGFIMMVNQITGIFFIIFSDYLMDNFKERYLPNILCGVLYIISLFSIFTMKPVLKRNEVDHMK